MNFAFCVNRESMKLNDFLSRRGVSKSAFAHTIGTSVATVSRIGDGIVVPRRELLVRIYHETDGLVTPNDLVGLHCVEACPRRQK